tara:strand:+ start:1822 stop:2694 length:873 start_codon:yes stop_codon:yes gene_type:complete
MNIALTGSSGLIGSQLLIDLSEMGHNILCISSSISNTKEKNIYSYEELKFGDINFKADCLLHLASINSDLQESEVSLEVDLLEKAMNIMKTLECKHLVFFSTIKVYGENSLTFQEFKEDSSLEPRCFYGEAKKKCEEKIAENSKNNSFKYIILRLPPIFINNPNSNIGKLFKIVQKGLPVPSFSIGNENKRSFLSYDLLIYVLSTIFSDLSKIKNTTFNISDTKAISTNDLFKKIGSNEGKRVRIFYLPDIVFTFLMKVNRLQLILIKLFGNFYISNAKLRQEFKIPDHF